MHHPIANLLRITAKSTIAIAGFCVLNAPLYAQFVGENFRNATAPDWTLKPNTRLTAGDGTDPIGEGWLRLTENLQDQVGEALFNGAFPSTEGFVAKFDYVMWNSRAGVAADGISFFLYDPSVTDPMANATYGAGLGYCHGNGGLLAVGLDAQGNFIRSNPNDLVYCSTGGNLQINNIIAVRGPVTTGNPLIGTPISPVGTIYNSSSSSRPAETRSVQLSMLPLAGGGFYVTLDEGPTGSVLSRLITGNYEGVLPDTLSIGFGASTGLYSQVSEVRMNSMTKPVDISLTTTVPVQNGNTVTHTFTLSNNPLIAGGAAVPITNPSDAPLLSETTAPDLRNIRWTCAASGAGTTCPAPNGTGPIQDLGNYLLGETGSLTFTVSGTVACATNTVQTHTVMAAFPPTSSFDDATPANSIATASGPVTTDSCPAPTPVPSLGHLGLALLSLIAAAFGALGLNRHRVKASKGSLISMQK